MLGYPKDVENLIFKEENLIEHMKSGSLLIDHTTSSPSLARRISEECRKKNIGSLDAPVSGGDIGAKEGKLVIMTGGENQDFEKASSIFKIYGKTIKLIGQAGFGQHCKMVNQIAIASGMIAVCEALVYGYKAGLDLNLVLETIGGGAAASFTLNAYGK